MITPEDAIRINGREDPIAEFTTTGPLPDHILKLAMMNVVAAASVAPWPRQLLQPGGRQLESAKQNVGISHSSSSVSIGPAHLTTLATQSKLEAARSASETALLATRLAPHVQPMQVRMGKKAVSNVVTSVTFKRTLDAAKLQANNPQSKRDHKVIAAEYRPPDRLAGRRCGINYFGDSPNAVCMGAKTIMDTVTTLANDRAYYDQCVKDV